MKRGHFIFLFILISILILYSEPTAENINLAGFACTAPLGGSGSQQTSCNTEVELNYLYDNVQTEGWKAKVVSGVPTVLIPRENIETQQSDYASYAPIYTPEHPASTSQCGYHYFEFKREGNEMSSDLQNIPDQTYVDETGIEHCVYDIEDFRNQVAEVLSGDATAAAKLNLPETVSTYEPKQNPEITQNTFVKDEKLASNADCQTGYEQTLEFTDNSGNTIRHCVLKESSFVSETEYVTNSYLEKFNGVETCTGGGEGTVWFIDKTGNSVYLCIAKSISESEEKTIRDSVLTESNCPENFVQSGDLIELEEKTIKQCILSETAFDKSLERTAKRTESLAQLTIPIVCPDLISGTREDTCPDGCCPTQTCEAEIPEGPKEFFGFTLEPLNNCAIEEANKNSNGIGLPITSDVDEFAQNGIDQCMENQEQTPPKAECGNGIIEEDEECELASSSSFFFMKDGNKNTVQRNMENSCQFYDQKYSSGILDCDSDCKIDLSKCFDVCNEDIVPATGIGECTCESSFNKLKTENSDSPETIDFDAILGNTWDIQHAEFPDRVDLEFSITSETDNFNIETGVPERFAIKIHMAGSKRDFPNFYCLVWGAEGDKEPFLDFRSRILNKTEKALPMYERLLKINEESSFSDVLGDFMFQPERSYRVNAQNEIKQILDEIDIPWSLDDSVWIEEDLTFYFVNLNQFNDEEIIPGDFQIKKDHLEYTLSEFGAKAFQGETANPFVIYTEDTVKFYNYYRKDTQVHSPISITSLYLPSLRTHNPKYYPYPGRLFIPVPWAIINKENPQAFLFSLENSVELTSPEIQESCNGNTIQVVPTHYPRLDLLRDIQECLADMSANN